MYANSSWAAADRAEALAGDTEKTMPTTDDRRRMTDDGQRGTRGRRWIAPALRMTLDAGCFKSEIGNRKSKMLSMGQAMVEFMVGLVVMLVLLAGLIQIGQLTHARTRTMIAARAAAGLLAMARTPPVSETALLISDWVPGPDQRRHTHDDMALASSHLVTLPGELVGQAHLERVSAAPTNALATLAMSPNPAGDFFLVKGQTSESVPILPVIRRLVYAHPTLEVESAAWLVWTEGIY